MKGNQREYQKNVLSLLKGTTISQFLPIIISPVLTRIYTPEDFGTLGVFTAILAILAPVACGRYEMTIILPAKERDAIALTSLSILIAFFISLLIGFILVIWDIAEVYEGSFQLWLYFLPIVVFFAGLFNALNFYCTRNKAFNNISSAKIHKSIVLSFTQIIMGFMKLGSIGLILGQVFSFVFANKKLTQIINLGKLYENFSWNTVKKLAIEYKNFPIFSVPAIMCFNLSQNISLFYISTYSTVDVGYYSLVNRVLMIPLAVLGSTVTQVFIQRASQDREITGNAISTFQDTLKKMLYITIPLFVILYFSIEDLIRIVFGEDWILAAEYTKIMIPLFFIRLLMMPLSSITVVFNRQRLEFVWQLGYLISLILVCYFSYSMKLQTNEFLVCSTLVSVVAYIVLFILVRKVSYAKK